MPTSAALDLNTTDKPFDQKRTRGLQAVLKLATGGSSHVSTHVTHGNMNCPEGSMSGQIPPAQVQDNQTSSDFQTSGKRSYPQREGSDDGEDEDTPRRKRSRTEKSPPFAKKLACPFHRNDTENHRKHRSCAGPGWTSIHRLKEHILRHHALPTYCPRCLKTFNAETECRLHLRQAALCPLSDSTPPEGYNKEQGTALRTRSKGNAEREWKAIYRLLFPGVPEELIPSPYYDDDDTQLEKLQRRESNRFQRHMEHTVPRSVSQLLEQTRFELSTSLDVPVRTRLVEIVVRAVAEASQSYRQRESPTTEAQAPAVLNRPSTLTQHPGTHGALDSILHLSTNTPTQEPFQPQANVQQHDSLVYELNHSTGIRDGIEHQDNDLRPGNELLVDPLLLDMSLFDWNPDQDTSFQGP
ncbi:hypothetical protein CCHR01_03767 [Colletotrichum chrysophilum]|uniref:C2H2-type domain-containing protein n=1 Tax=Colletotrichum chrysophilum TaxID=1836956 RepID=A0AAD9AT21_9PEZI|nr:hypothetical protein CCHR01_03767 [Colletotrichum chrysophilum]